MKPKLKDLDNVVIDCGTNERLFEVIKKLTIPPTQTQGVCGILSVETQIEIWSGKWESTAEMTPTHHINDIEL